MPAHSSVPCRGVGAQADKQVNGKRVPAKTVREAVVKVALTSKPVKLQHGYRVILGDFHVFRFNVSGNDRQD